MDDFPKGARQVTNHSSKSKSARLLHRFAGDARGNVAIFTALAALPLLVAAGVAIDTARASRSHNTLQVAVDSAALAAASSDKVNMAGLTTAQKATRKKELENLARNYVKSNYADEGAEATITVDVTDTTLTVTGQKLYPTTLMGLVGYKTVDIDARAEVNLQGGISENIEIILVMDTTGSMDQNNRLRDAKQAAKDLITTVLGDAKSDSKVKFALVPFSGSVNVGADKLNSGWIDTTGKASVSKVNFTDTNYHNMQAWNDMKYVNSKGQTVPLPWNGCVEARLGNLAVNDTVPTAATGDTLFTPYMAPDEPDSFYNNYISQSNEEKDLTGSKTDAKRQANQVKYATKTFTSLTGATGPWSNCAASAIVPLTTDRSVIESGIDAMQARGSTVLPEGLMWGWRVMSPNLPFTEGAAYTDKKWRKVLVFMTDGENDVGAGLNSLNGSYYTAYGFATAPTAKNRFGTTNSSSANSQLDSKLTTACTNLKANAEPREDPKNKAKTIPSIEVYTIAFQAPSAAKTLLKSCATSEGYYIDAANGTELKDAFKAIGARLKTMYLSK
nr:vWA domain-containing protein [Aestuariivirga sp. YIM B02566]